MELPPEIVELTKTHLGKPALAIQQKEGRGAWIATADNRARYVRADDLHKVIDNGDADDIAAIHAMVAAFDPAREVVLIFNMSADLQMVSVIEV